MIPDTSDKNRPLFPSVGLKAPVIALVLFAILFSPHLTKYYPKTGWPSLFFSPQFFFLVASLLIFKLKAIPLSAVFSGANVTRKGVTSALILGLAPAGLFALTLFIGLWVPTIRGLLPDDILGGPDLKIRFSILSLFTLLIWAPFTEEVFFRGIFVRALRDHYSLLPTTLFSALIFMAGHAPGGLSVSFFGLALSFNPGPFILGLITAPLFLKTRSIYPVIIFHAISNAYVPILGFWFPNLYRYFSVLIH